MPYNSRDPNASTGKAAHQYLISRSLAIAVLIALVALFALRQVYGSVTVAAGSS
jgi:hypothetical protein